MHPTSKLLVVLMVLQCVGFAAIEIVERSPTKLVLDIDVPAPMASSIQIEGAPYTRLLVDDFSVFSEAGYPELPALRLPIVVPSGRIARAHLESRAPRISVSLAAPLSYRAVLDPHSATPRTVSRNGKAYRRAHGETSLVLEEEGLAGEDRVAVFRFSPFFYQPVRGRLSYLPKARVTIRFEAVAEKVATASERPSLLAATEGIVLNPEMADDRLSVADTKPIDLVIAHEFYEEPLQRYLEFKNSRGREVRTYFVRDKSAADIRAIIQQEYQSSARPTHTILVGSFQQIPGWPGTGDNALTDFNYQLLDRDQIPDLSLGRIPARNVGELQAFLNKTIARELRARDVEKVLLTAGRDVGLGCPANMSKVGKQFTTGGNSVQVVKRYRTSVSTRDVIDAYNDNPNLIAYDGHGDESGMLEIPLQVSSLSQLSNRTFPILLDIACLNAAFSASGRNFAESILFAEGRGVAGILASGGSGYGHPFFQTIAKLMADGRKKRTLRSELNEVGQLILLAKIQHTFQDRSFWNYYGDPASSVWESR